ncbi:NAD-P-binding protein [Dentipellis sp. KUC8613]|nr:NAD-P-binding protein [Dentipellis sp. KUC8613]
MGIYTWAAALASPILVLYLYIRSNDAKLTALPKDLAAAFSPHRLTPEDARKAAEELAKSPITVDAVLPPKTGRRYIVVGGAGFLGGWIVCHLLRRGEDPRHIRVLDIRLPTRPDLTTGPANDVDFRQVDVSDKAAVDAAFHAPWPSTGKDAPAETTVFHTAANIRFYERHPDLQHLSDKVNVQGVQNILDAARAIGTSILIYTSSGSISVRRSRFWLWPWQKEPAFFAQVITDDDSIIPKRHEHTFSNYAASKIKGEKLVRAANGTPSDAGGVLLTGSIRPGNGVYGPGGDILCGSYLVRQVNPTWIGSILQNFIYVENCSLAHLCYEARLLETMHSQGSPHPNPNLGGDAFCVTDAGPPVTYGDVYTTLHTLTDGLTVFPEMSATAMLLLSHLFELVHLARMLPSPLSLRRLVPALNGDLVNLQPSLFALTMVHLVWDDSRARAPPEKGGLGYEPQWTTLQGLCALVEAHKKAGGKGEERSMGGGVSFGFASTKAGRGVERVIEGLGVDPTTVKN